MASTSGIQSIQQSISGTHESIEQCNMQTTWLVPTKYQLHWKIEDVCDFKEFKCPKMSGPADTKFQVFLRLKDVGKYFVEMESFSPRGPLQIKGEISVNSEIYLPIKRSIKKRFSIIKLQIDPVPVSENNTLEVRLEFIAFPVLNQFLKVNKNAAKFGEKLRDLATEVNLSTMDCFLQIKSGSTIWFRRCQSAILAARSPTLDSWLDINDTIPVSTFGNYNDSVLQGILDYLYTANPYMLIANYSLSEIKEIVKLGQILKVSEIDSLFEEREFSIFTKSHNCGTMFEVTMTNKEFFQLKSEANAKIEFPNFSFCKSEWNLSLVKNEISENGMYTIILKQISRVNVTNIETHVSYLNLQKEWAELQKVTREMEADDKKAKKKVKPKNKKRKYRLETEENTRGSKKNEFEFEIENEFLQELFKSPISSQAEKFQQLVLKCEMKHKIFSDDVDLKVKSLDAFRFLYDRQHFNGLYADLKKLYDSKRYVDLKVNITSSCLFQKQFKAHKIVFAARSSVFKQKIIESNDGEIKVEVDVDLLENFDQIIRFLYTNEIDFEIIPALQVYQFAFSNSVIDLMNSARIYITEHLSENIATNAMKGAIKCEDEMFKDNIKNYMSRYHCKKWDPKTNEFIPRPNDSITRSHEYMDSENFVSESNEIMDTNGSDYNKEVKPEIMDNHEEDDNQEDESLNEE